MRIVLIAVVLAVAGLLVSASQIAPARAAAAHAASGGGPKPTIVLEHGAWADGSSWDGVIGLLQADGYPVYAPPNPLRGLANDSATLSDFLKTLSGPVILVGHSYGGMVITNAATGDPNVKALVYISAFIPARAKPPSGSPPPGRILRGSANAFPRRALPGAPAEISTPTSSRPRPALPGFAQCSPTACLSRAAMLAATQRPIAFSTGSEPSGIPGWQAIPSWSLIGTADHVIPPAEQLFMSQRAHARITEINAGHLSLISHPGAVTRVIIAAAQATG
jgi:pimeloyl-ACP methyl ester carboxylesterase